MKKILILAANPRKDLDLRREIHILKSRIERSQAQDEQDEFEVEIGSGVSSAQIQTLFHKHQPQIVHFCGHGAGKQGLVFEDDESEKLVSNEALSDLFKLFSHQVECVLLNACYSDIQATEISRHINYVVGMKQAIRDDAAIVFARGFYQALGYKQSIENAYDLGCNAIKIQIDNSYNYSSEISEAERKFINRKLESQRLPENLKPQLKIKSPLTRFPNQERVNSGQDLPDVIELFQDEIKRKKYKEDTENDFNLGRNNVDRGQPLTQQEYRWRKVLLSKVKDSWIEGVLKKSLFSQVLFEQTITNRSDTVERPFSGLEEFGVESDKSFEFIQASDIFEGMDAGRTLLILGEPGTGKTISLLKLAERLIKKTEEDLTLPIPVVFNLSSWAIKRQSIADWLVKELKDKYQVSTALAKRLIEQEELILLLDGLDEVKAKYRNDCVSALNKFINAHGITEMVVCCRVKDYEALSERLKLRNAICIQPLSSEYINWYLEDVGKPLVGLKQLLQKDKELEEFARTPLIFSVMSIAYQGYSLEELLEEMSVKEKRYERLFDSYIKRMFTRKEISLSKKHKKKITIQYLSWLAKSLQKESQSMFLIEKMQPSWLTSLISRIIYEIVVYLIGGVSLGLIVQLYFIFIINIGGALTNELISELLRPDNLFLLFLTCGTLFSLQQIKTIEIVKWSYKKSQKSFNDLFKDSNIREFCYTSMAFYIFLILGNIWEGKIKAIKEIILSSFNALFIFIVFGFLVYCFKCLLDGFTSVDIKNRSMNNEGIWKSIINSFKLPLIALIILCLISYLILLAFFELDSFDNLIFQYFLAIATFLMFIFILAFPFLIVWCGGKTVIQHFTLRIIISFNHYAPWNYANFLNYATERLFMQKVGGGYIFIHRMLMEHFANMKLD
ncbi:NACHT domain-containing protein [Dapis sp. BLCC M229]|uniref:NACHT domain-containing protein n=1 Tax=Dapis sp. BLCC M229 TaxID=3400188 RepID=UPI003CE737A3